MSREAIHGGEALQAGFRLVIDAGDDRAAVVLRAVHEAARVAARSAREGHAGPRGLDQGHGATLELLPALDFLRLAQHCALVHDSALVPVPLCGVRQRVHHLRGYARLLPRRARARHCAERLRRPRGRPLHLLAGRHQGQLRGHEHAVAQHVHHSDERVRRPPAAAAQQPQRGVAERTGGRLVRQVG